MIPVSYDLKRLIAEFGVPWKPEIRKWLISAPVYVITIGKDGELWGKTREGLVLPHDSILFEWEFPPTGIWSHFTVFALYLRCSANPGSWHIRFSASERRGAGQRRRSNAATIERKVTPAGSPTLTAGHLPTSTTLS